MLGIVDLSIGDVESAVVEMFRALEKRDNFLIYVQCEPVYDKLREHRRYPELLAGLGFDRLR
jgi:hypothetical protein